MTTKQMDCILELARTLNFNRAAENLFISQPTMTYQVSEAEAEIGFRIFERSGRGAALTPAGRQFVTELKEIRRRLKKAIEQGQNFSARYLEDIRISLPIRSAVCFLPEAIRRFSVSHPSVSVTPWFNWNYLDYEDATVESRKVYEACERFHKPVLVMEPVKGGSLARLPEEAQKVFDALQKDGAAKKSNASYALRFAASLPNVCAVLSGMSDMAQMRDNIDAMRDFAPLTAAEQAALEQVREVFRGMGMIPCTACHYCVLDNDCPKKIPIPELFACYNAKTQFHDWNQDYYYRNILTRDAGKASGCIRCGKCEKICPQHLSIRELLKDVAREFERKA